MALADLLANPDADWVYLLDAQPLVDATPTTQDVGFSRGAVISPLFGGTARQFPPALLQALNVTTQINPLGLLAGPSTSFGAIEIENGDGRWDSLIDLAWDGRPVVVKLGRPTDALASFEAIFTGKAIQLLYDESRLSILIRDHGIDLANPIQTNLYAGDGTSYEGNADLKDVPKPLAFGSPKNITPVKVDGSTDRDIYQVHDGKAKSITVYDQMVALTNAGDVSDLTTAAAPTAGQYKTDLNRGLFRLGAKPAGIVTCDVEGENNGASVTFPQKCSDIVKHILLTYTGRVSGDLDSTSFTDLNTDAAAFLSLYTGTTAPSIAQVIGELLDSVGAYYYFDRNGKVIVGQAKFRTPSLTLDYSSAQIASLRRVRGLNPVWYVKLGWKRMWTVLRATDFAGAVTQATRDERSLEYRYAGSGDTGHLALHALAEAVERRGHLDSSSDAASEAVRQQALLEAHDRIIEIDARNVQFQIDPGDTITVKHPRYGFDGSGLDAFVLGVTENSNGRATRLTVLV